MAGPERPQFVLFGSSIVHFSYSSEGWGTILTDIYSRKDLDTEYCSSETKNWPEELEKSGSISGDVIDPNAKQLKKSNWANLFRDSRKPSNGTQLCFVEKDANNLPVVIFTEKDAPRVFDEMPHCLVGLNEGCQIPTRHTLPPTTSTSNASLLKDVTVHKQARYTSLQHETELLNPS